MPSGGCRLEAGGGGPTALNRSIAGTAAMPDGMPEPQNPDSPWRLAFLAGAIVVIHPAPRAAMSKDPLQVFHPLVHEAETSVNRIVSPGVV